jgi:hypothetical protein
MRDVFSMPDHFNVLRSFPPAALLVLAACNQSADPATDAEGASPAAAGTAASGVATAWNGGKAKPLTLQVAHPSGAVLQVSSIQAGDMETRVGVRVINGRDRDIDLNRFNNNRDGFLQLETGEKLYLSPPPTNSRLTVPAGQTFEGDLVFLGRLPLVNSAILVLNENSSADSEHTTTPGFRVDLPLGGAMGGAAQ